MPSYRTTSLFHYTKEVDNLFNILQSGKLTPNYCMEDLSTKDKPDFIWGIPMVCFCDIPISLANNFLDNYGKYAIGLNKNWGITNGCNPIQYVSNENILFSLHHFLARIITLQEIEKGELLDYAKTLKDFAENKIAELFQKKIEHSNRINTLLEEANPNYSKQKNFSNEILKIKKQQDDFQEELNVFIKEKNDLDLVYNHIMDFLGLFPKDNTSSLYYIGFLKKYESEWQNKPYINYDENEWRYIVEETDSIKWLYNEEYEKWRGDKENNPKPKPTEALVEKSLKFSPSDIHHIILFEESEIPAFIRKIRTLKKIGDTVLDDDTKDILISKISSFERIKKDY